MQPGHAPSVLEPGPASVGHGRIHVTLTQGFRITRGEDRVELTPASQRLVAFLALTRHPVRRRFVAATLWLDGPDNRALGNLRTSIWRARHAGGELVVSRGDSVALAPGVEVDLHRLVEWAHRVERPGDLDLDEGHLDELIAADELLGDWYDEWLEPEREQYRQQRLNALEAACRRLSADGRFGRATEVGQTAIAAEPLRESAHRALMAVFLAQGNLVAAQRQYEAYRRLLRDELGVEPTPLIRQLVPRVGLPPA
jgi:DNA-binding SARP family transcriptional activator